MKFHIPFQGEKPFDVVGMGLNAVDDLVVVPHYPPCNTKVRIRRMDRQGGGQVATAMVALAKWGVRVRYIGKMGDDERGEFSLRSLKDMGIDVAHVTVEPGAVTQHSIIMVDAQTGDRTIMWDRDNRLMYREDELDKEAVCSGRILHLDGHDVAATLQVLPWAKEAGIPSMKRARTSSLVNPVRLVR